MPTSLTGSSTGYIARGAMGPSVSRRVLNYVPESPVMRRRRCRWPRRMPIRGSDGRVLEPVEPLVPQPARDPDKQYKRAAGAGRPSKPPRLVFEAIMYVLHWLPMEGIAC